jgi:hypothetical protein
MKDLLKNILLTALTLSWIGYDIDVLLTKENSYFIADLLFYTYFLYYTFFSKQLN